ncbi:MAG TPA: hypothetical protein VE709_09790 [Pseudonocardiaceae bacterium]|nr:hypothetical protein [Pseudonocardiaceae bacterium]
MGSSKKKVTGADLIGGKLKEKCCRSRPRCKRCPVVALRLERAGAASLTGRQLKKALKKARAA